MAKQKQADLLAMAIEATTANVVKSRSGSGRTTYLDRFVSALLDDDGNPTEAKSRIMIIAIVSLAICNEKRDDAIKATPEGEDAPAAFLLTPSRDTEDDAEFAKMCVKVKNQVNAAIANNQNATSLSYSAKYKDVWSVVKHEDGKISLAAKSE